VKRFGTTHDGRVVHQVTIGAGDLSATLLTWGAVVQEVRLAGVTHSLTLGSDTLADYLGPMRHHGALIGPIANRIRTARARIDGMVYELERNQDERIHLHSGDQGTHRQIWQVDECGADSVTLSLDLPDGMCGLPGNRRITARFGIEAPATLRMDLTGTTDATTLMNFANHSFWNLDGTADFAGHRLWIDARHYLPTDADDCPTGEIAETAETAYDFTTARAIGPRRPALDTNFCIARTSRPLQDVLRLTGKSGVSMTLGTTSPGVQVYDARHAQRPGKGPYEGLAIEPQYWPDAPDNPHFPSIKVTAGTGFAQTTTWRFAR